MTKTQRYLVPLHHEHPHEAQLITELTALPMHRRAARVRELLTCGAFRDLPPVPYTNGHARGDLPRPPMRLGVYLYGNAPGDSAVLADIGLVHPKLVNEFLRDRMIAGLLGQPQAIDINIDIDFEVESDAFVPKSTSEPIVSTKANPIAVAVTPTKIHNTEALSSQPIPSPPALPPQPQRDPETGQLKRPELLRLFT